MLESCDADPIKTQLESYERFRQQGLRELFDEISPIEGYNGDLKLYFPGSDTEFNEEWGLGYRFAEPTYIEEECRERGMTYATPMCVKVLLQNKIADVELVQEVPLGDLPIMTVRGTFVIDGVDYPSPKTVEEVLTYLFRVRFLRMVRAVRERMSVRDPEEVSPWSLIKTSPHLSIRVVSLTSPVRIGSEAKLTISTIPNAACTLTVYSKAGWPSGAYGLADQNADGDGMATWRWRVHSRLTPGVGRIVVACTSGDQRATFEMPFEVR